MTSKRAVLSLVLIASLSLAVSCAHAATPAGGPDDRELNPADAQNVLVPHKSWTCGMPEGIPKPENDALLFETELKLDQVYDLGKTQFGQRQALVFSGGVGLTFYL